MLSRSLFGLILAFFVAAPLHAQTAQAFSIQGSLLGQTVGGEAFEGIEVDPGGGIELQARWNPSAFSIGAGFQTTAHTSSFDFEGNTFDVDFTFTGFFIEPRYVIFIGSERAAPYVAARVMSLNGTLGLPELDFEEDFDARGWSAGGGLLFVLNPRINADLGLTVGQMTLEFDDGAEDSGTAAVIRLGLAYGI